MWMSGVTESGNYMRSRVAALGRGVGGSERRGVLQKGDRLSEPRYLRWVLCLQNDGRYR
jgi:hypothetical protein